MKKLTALLASAALTLSLSGAGQAVANTLPPTINWTIPFGVGGGTDVWARFVSPHLDKYLTDSPTLVIKNVPGGGSITGTNLFYNRARSDGSDIIGTSASTLYPYMLGDQRVHYDFNKWTAILASPTGGVVYIQPDLGVKGAADLAKLKDTPMPFAAQGPTQLELPVMMALDMLGFNLKPVFGMKSRGEGRLAFERGEAKVDFQTTSAYLASVKDLEQQGKAVPLFSLGILNGDGKVVRDPAFPDIPTFQEVYKEYKGEEPSGPEYEVYFKFFAAGFAFQKVLFIPTDVPAAVYDSYISAVEKMVKDPDFNKEAVEQIGPYENITGRAAEQYISDAVNMSPERQQWVKNWLQTKFNVSVN
ncbi:tricarboxylate transporter [Pokkaliibacter plantistimulans]|uniref:Tricarboxylate transporter n=1 Tax=Proteobacteria bacterium 228 TaxID=2083153 RepID=A0A2S5KN36_9PROT|nr:tricarboxylate transporter [Pokkaliibacter plantistimulans]PPC76045.1 tricarboxylate transporter [Pokkaliibacter plantistimulans]